MMDPVWLWGHQNMAQRSQIGSNIAMIKASVPFLEDGESYNVRRVDLKDQEGNHQTRFPDEVFQNMVAKIREEVEFRLRMVKLVELPKQRHFVIQIMLQPVKEIH